MADKLVRNKAITFATSIASGHGVRHAAKVADISERTAYRWLKKEAIQRRIKSLHDHATSRAKAILTTAKVSAARALVKASKEGDVKAQRIILLEMSAMEGAVNSLGRSQDKGLDVPGLDVRWNREGAAE